MFDDNDRLMMQNALSLAWQGRFSTSPNPRVGCVIAHGSQIVGQGFHVRAGEPHAEVHALRQAGAAAKDATAYVTLEPCSHYGRTPPCAEALVHSGISRVVAAMTDPNPLVAGKGLAMLHAAGIQIESGLLEQEARILNRGFLSRIERRRPFIRLKCAASLDGKTALADGSSQWITGQAARHDVQILRAESCAVLTGIGTVLADNPRLNVRAFPTLRQPARVILDSKLQTPPESHVVTDGSSPTIIATLVDDENRHRSYLAHSHVRIIRPSANRHGQIDLHDLLGKLAELGFGEVMVEAGAILTSAFIAEDLADEIILYQAPKILGNPGRGLLTLPENPSALTQSAPWHTAAVETVGNDVKWTLQRM
ncbi:bifunctional diaminohydroxyphosphoribosylaminopyrimidine deaminase/5-amino-6-(5-phosphoribosylamino)uracil reductase RibD [Neisseria animalis]|uniref:Riboflavin biosynthesis protein RibD n=1 Tax=Neisseria animalis TaxID=492 RepID=A0A5P3MS62_NEIAN|nr:bifunctional diaminohydroxyphosphoribosylaminopyrimidine deaminase/5-amino-6-(5-phosphoribosylamino)uracil reductase RibD [Neisseria animalis]QEY23631.1 bifunctional diaminohydroxyphosphoribosylaminopyrimidine deaminase/5-amino-6-(5-phosphoribosylamino)uracil reductase RibD [Neisseria animalis]ROW32776.1 bifunctional diaminohydroxyphosphoribosylaminopyrimidine deaminase/5-amino-6-(5-phosphoribosylamino)uracil reductase RibD [Neisseria animalis]VEE09375.1 diaminohydroxyphosphoribosylaminopyrim